MKTRDFLRMPFNEAMNYTSNGIYSVGIKRYKNDDGSSLWIIKNNATLLHSETIGVHEDKCPVFHDEDLRSYMSGFPMFTKLIFQFSVAGIYARFHDFPDGVRKLEYVPRSSFKQSFK